MAIGDFRLLLRVLFGANVGDLALKRLFDSLDSARRGTLEWRTVLDYMTPLVCV